MISCEFCKISKNTFSYKTPPVAASKNLRSFASDLSCPGTSEKQSLPISSSCYSYINLNWRQRWLTNNE